VSIYLVVPLLVVVALLQTTIMPHLAIWGVFPDLSVLVVASRGLLKGSGEGVLWGFITGVALDLLSSAPSGTATVSLIVVGFASGLAKGSVLQAHITLPMLTMFLVTIVYNLTYLLILQISGRTVIWLDSIARIILPSALLNAILTPVIFGGMRWLDTRFSQEEMEW
jgi:rod shape-determining protein MreD